MWIETLLGLQAEGLGEGRQGHLEEVQGVDEAEARFAREDLVLGHREVQHLAALHDRFRDAVDALHHRVQNEDEVVALA